MVPAGNKAKRLSSVDKNNSSSSSLQAYQLLLSAFPSPVISLLNKIQESAVGAIKALNVLKEKNKISEDCIMMFDEMYLQKLHSIRAANMFGLMKSVLR